MWMAKGSARIWRTVMRGLRAESECARDVDALALAAGELVREARER